MKISVNHEIANDEKYCMDGDTGGWYIVCKYLKGRLGKPGGLYNSRQPRCTLFNEWVEKEQSLVTKVLKCRKCLDAVAEAKRLEQMT